MKKKNVGHGSTPAKVSNVSKVDSVAYANAGVSLSAGDVFSAFAGEIGKKSFNNSRFVQVCDFSKGHFRGPRGWQYVGLPNGWFNVVAPDGIGTATIIISAAGEHRTASSRLLAMTAGDITRYGGLPLVFTNILETKTLDDPGSSIFEAYKSMMVGMGNYAKDQGYVLMGGETAEMGVCVSGEIIGPSAIFTPTYNWSGVMSGVNHPDKVINGNTLKAGQRVIALRDALRSNGGSMMRKYFRTRFNDHWWLHLDAQEYIKAAAAPAALYDRFLAEMNGWYDGDFQPIVKMHAIAHISGGGIHSKFAEDILFPRGLSALLDNLWEPPSFMSDCVRDMAISDKEAYTIFNGGQGALVVVDEGVAKGFCICANEHGIEARPAGVILKKSKNPRVEIVSKFTGKTFAFK